MIAGEDFKRANAAGTIEPKARTSAGCPLRLSWALSRVPALPTPDLAQRLAAAMLELAGRDRAVALQIGRLDAGTRWRAEQTGVSGRLHDGQQGGIVFEPHHHAPWNGTLPAMGGPQFGVETGPIAGPALRPIEVAMRRVGLGIDAAALACSGDSGGLVVTLQLGEHRRIEEASSKEPTLRLVLPWVLSIVQNALGEGKGEDKGKTPREWLTPREAEVLELLVKGRSIVEVARALGRSPYTVHDHAKSLHRKLGVHTRAALVGRATIGVPPPGTLE